MFFHLGTLNLAWFLNETAPQLRMERLNLGNSPTANIKGKGDVIHIWKRNQASAHDHKGHDYEDLTMSGRVVCKYVRSGCTTALNVVPWETDGESVLREVCPTRASFHDLLLLSSFIFYSVCFYPIRSGLDGLDPERSHPSWDNKKYRARGHPRYHLFSIGKLCKDKNPGGNVIKEKLMAHFLGDGPKLPWVGDLYNSGSLRDFEKAKTRVGNNEIYRHPRDSLCDKRANHSVLIVGIDVSADEAVDHYVEVKCSWGEKYGDKGFTRVSFDVFTTVWYPCQNPEDGTWFGTRRGPSETD
ncbi:bulb-type lectin domain-containing protein [Tanacetum coccineum]